MLALERPFARVESVLEEACGRWFTGAVARIECGGTVRFERAYGVTRDDGGVPVRVDTLFDLASITKIYITVLALQSIEDGALPLDGSLDGILPEWKSAPHCAISLRMLLAHTSGMNSGADYRELLDRNIVRFALERDLVAAPGERVIYSDLGFIVVGEILQRVRGRSLPALIDGTFSEVRYRPPLRARRSIPATEDDGWRGRVQGIVHDEKAYFMGGVAGHAGLFGTAAGVARLGEMFLGPLRGRSGVVPAAMVAQAVAEQAPDPILRRGLGWALKTSDQNSCGRFWSHRTFGHTGFVGTCIWADPQRDCSAVLLTNGVYFGRADTRDLRASFYEAALYDLGAA